MALMRSRYALTLALLTGAVFLARPQVASAASATGSQDMTTAITAVLHQMVDLFPSMGGPQAFRHLDNAFQQMLDLLPNHPQGHAKHHKAHHHHQQGAGMNAANLLTGSKAQAKNSNRTVAVAASQQVGAGTKSANLLTGSQTLAKNSNRTATASRTIQGVTQQTGSGQCHAQAAPNAAAKASAQQGKGKGATAATKIAGKKK